MQGCRSYITPWPSDFNLEGLKRDDANNGQNLVYPREHVEVPPQVNRKSKQDIHLVFEYLMGETILGVVAPRSNRFYFSHDPNGASL